MRYRDKDGVRRRESTLTEDWDEAQKRLRERLQARDNNTLPALRRGQDLTFGEWTDFYLENFSKPPFRALKTHEINERALKHLRVAFEKTKLAELTADDIEGYLRWRLKQRVQVKAKEGFVAKGLLKATTVHQELRVLRRMLNVAVRKKFLFANPCSGVEFPARVDGLFRPHYVTWSEQQKIELAGAGVLAQRHPDRDRNGTSDLQGADTDEEGAARSGERDGVDSGLENTEWHAEVPLTEIAVDAFRKQLALSGPSPFPLPERREIRRLSEDVQDRLARDTSPGEGSSIFGSTISDPRTPPGSAPGRRRRVGHAVAPAGRRKGIQEVLANEAADEARGAGEIEPPSERKRPGFWHSHRANPSRVLAQFWHSRGKGTAKAMGRRSINSFGISRRFGRGGAI